MFIKLKQRKAGLYLPIRARTPHPSHTIKLRPTEPVLIRTPFGDINIPEPTNKYVVYFFCSKVIYSTKTKINLIKKWSDFKYNLFMT